jgi:hypothetical protein
LDGQAGDVDGYPPLAATSAAGVGDRAGAARREAERRRETAEAFDASRAGKTAARRCAEESLASVASGLTSKDR